MCQRDTLSPHSSKNHPYVVIFTHLISGGVKGECNLCEKLVFLQAEDVCVCVCIPKFNSPCQNWRISSFSSSSLDSPPTNQHGETIQDPSLNTLTHTVSDWVEDVQATHNRYVVIQCNISLKRNTVYQRLMELQKPWKIQKFWKNTLLCCYWIPF